jgi:hypothetical protein
MRRYVQVVERYEAAATVSIDLVDGVADVTDDDDDE